MKKNAAGQYRDVAPDPEIEDEDLDENELERQKSYLQLRERM